MLLYLDLNCFNRPFDDQGQERIAKETEAVFSILQRIVNGTDQMAWSAVLSFENSRHPLADRREEIGRWVARAFINVTVDEEISTHAQELVNRGIKPLDAAHLACAEAAGCDRFLTCDDRLLRAANRTSLRLRVQNPVDCFQEYADGETTGG